MILTSKWKKFKQKRFYSYSFLSIRAMLQSLISYIQVQHTRYTFNHIGMVNTSIHFKIQRKKVQRKMKRKNKIDNAVM